MRTKIVVFVLLGSLLSFGQAPAALSKDAIIAKALALADKLRAHNDQYRRFAADKIEQTKEDVQVKKDKIAAGRIIFDAQTKQLATDAAPLRAELMKRLHFAANDDSKFADAQLKVIQSGDVEHFDANTAAAYLQVLAMKYKNFDGTTVNCDRRCR